MGKTLITVTGDEKWYDHGYNETTNTKFNHSDEVYLTKLESATKYMKQEVEQYEQFLKTNKRSEEGWLNTVAEKGTMSDRLSAIQLKVQNSPVHSLGHLEKMVDMFEKKKMHESINVLKCLKTVLVNNLLPPDRKLVAFDQRPLSKVISSGNNISTKRRLILWKFEDDLKKLYLKIVKIAEAVSSNIIEGIAEQTCIIIADLLVERPEREQELLNILVSRIGHPKKKVQVSVTLQLEKLVQKHPNMRMVVVSELERLIFRKNINERTQFYSVHALTRIPLRTGDEDLALKLLKIYFSLFHILVAKKAVDRNRLLAMVVRGANHAFKYAKDRTTELVGELEELYRIVHTAAKFSTALHTLRLLYQMMTHNMNLSDRFYSTLYQRLLRVRSTKADRLFFSLMEEVLKTDTTDQRVRAFLKRLLQLAVNNDPPFASAVLILYDKIIRMKPSLSRAPEDADVEDNSGLPAAIVVDNAPKSAKHVFDDDDEEEHYEDAPDPDEPKTNGRMKSNGKPKAKRMKFDDEGNSPQLNGKKASATKGWVHRDLIKQRAHVYIPDVRNPLFANADLTTDSELQLLARHYHPAVAHFARDVIERKPLKYRGNPLIDFTLIRFLDRFAYRNPKVQEGEEGPKRYEPSGAKRLNANSDTYAKQDINEIALDERFLHRFINFKASDEVKKANDENGDDDFDDMESVNSDEFDAVLEQFEPGEANDVFDIEFSKELKNKPDPSKMNSKERRKLARKNDQRETQLEGDSDAESDVTDPDAVFDSDDADSDDGELDGGDGDAGSDADEDVSDNDEEDNKMSDDEEEEQRGKKHKFVPKKPQMKKQLSGRVKKGAIVKRPKLSKAKGKAKKFGSNGPPKKRLLLKAGKLGRR